MARNTGNYYDHGTKSCSLNKADEPIMENARMESYSISWWRSKGSSAINDEDVPTAATVASTASTCSFESGAFLFEEDGHEDFYPSINPGQHFNDGTSCNHVSEEEQVETRQYFAQSPSRQLPPASLLQVHKNQAARSRYYANDDLKDLARKATQLFPGTLPQGIPSPFSSSAQSHGNRNNSSVQGRSKIKFVNRKTENTSFFNKAKTAPQPPSAAVASENRSNLFHALEEFSSYQEQVRKRQNFCVAQEKRRMKQQQQGN